MTNAPATLPTPSATAPSTAPGRAPAVSLLRAFAVAALVVAALAVAAGVALRALGALDAGALAHGGLGAGAALLAGLTTLVLHGRFLDPRTTAPFASDGRLAGARLQTLLAAAFAVKLAVLVAGVLVLRQIGAKFADVAAFAVTFAAAALACQVATAMCLVRALQQQRRTAPARPAADLHA
jgi:hypothetical protein